MLLLALPFGYTGLAALSKTLLSRRSRRRNFYRYHRAEGAMH